MAKKSRSFVRLFDENNHYIKFVEYDVAAKKIRDGQWTEKQRKSGNLIEVRVAPLPPNPSTSLNSNAMISERECRLNAFAHLKLKLGEKLNAAEEVVLEKMAGFTPGAVNEAGDSVYLGKSWSDRVVYA